jgi:hypothetical protein
MRLAASTRSPQHLRSNKYGMHTPFRRQVHPAGEAVREWACLLGNPGAFLPMTSYWHTSCDSATRVLSCQLFLNVVL